MPVLQQIGRTGKFFVAEEATYAAAVVLAGGDAMRHLEVGFSYNLNRSNSLERRGTPGLLDRFSRHIVAGFDLRAAYLNPSGTLGTVGESDPIIKNGMGAVSTSTAATTVASGSSATVFTVQAGQGTNFPVGKVIAIRRAANGSIVEPRRVTVQATDTLTVSPALGGTPASGDTVKRGVDYTLANLLPKSLVMARYLANQSFELQGAVVDKLGFTINGNDEVKFRASGPAKTQIRPAQAEPGAFTTVGSPVTGIVGAMLLNGTAYKLTNFDIEINNMIELVNDSVGQSAAEDYYRNGRRDITLSVDARITDDASLYALAEAASDGNVMIHAGNTEGRVIAFCMPRSEWDIPDTPDDEGALRWSFKGVAKEILGNDELIVALL